MSPAWEDIEKTAQELGLAPCALSAVCAVEANGDGFLPDGRCKILFEPHIFWQQLQKRGFDPAGLLRRADVKEIHGDISDILYKKWRRGAYGSESAQWGRLQRAMAIDQEAALASSSWGAFQIMGFNYQICGFGDVFSFVAAMKSGYAGQLQALAGFLKANDLIKHLKTHNWAAFARGYNGAGYAQNKYDVKLKAAYEKCLGQK